VPELPEVETVRRGLEPVLTGRRLALVECRRPDLRFPLPDRFAERLMGRTIENLSRRAKYLIAHLSGGDALVMHLGMTGRFTVLSGKDRDTLGTYVYETSADPRHDHIVFHVSGRDRVVYNDPRRFGFMLLIGKNDLDTHPMFAGLGPEPLSDAFDAGYLAARARNKKVNLKSLLMDQRVVAGLGNIYVSEALFRAKLAPDRMAGTLARRDGRPSEKAGTLVAAVKEVLMDAIAAGGSTLKDYRHADGSEGQFQESFSVYDRAGEPCVRPGCKGKISRGVHTGRATFSCPVCQK
jgi:formamidopyrimidine-DNA glycosylase